MAKLEHRRFQHAEWVPISRRDARKLLLREVCLSEEGATLLLDDLLTRKREEVDCRTRGTVRVKPDGRKRGCHAS